MDRDATKLYCPNPSCQAPNAEGNKFCQRCRTLLPKRYLWAIEMGNSDPLPPLLDDRYLLKHNRIYLDTQPGVLPHVPEKVPPEIRAYLRLFPYRWNLPQVYGSANTDDERSIWLLEHAPIERLPNGTWRQLPHIDLAWGCEDDLHKLGWLWQILSLWTDCVREGVASTLLDPMSVRIEGSFVRLAQLVPDAPDRPPNLVQLGRRWSRWVSVTKPPLRDFFDQFCQQIIDGQLHTPEQAQIVLDRALDRLKETRSYQWQVSTLSDRGPSRPRNEDACFPLTEKPAPPQPQALGIVCDGVGGHDGGDIASELAVNIMAERVAPHHRSTPHGNPEQPVRAEMIERVREAIAEANDAIGQRNNDEQRQGRQRMGTTIVMGQGDGNDLFISHVGDSRAYLVNQRAFYPLTVDDDVASREVRLGYAFYRSAVHQPAAGSLVQALGMGASSHLYPTTQRFIVNEDCVVLLCSDGLSDYDRVEQHWKTELQPILSDAVSLSGAAHRLVEIANTQNGHDNVTVALMRLRVIPRDRSVSSESLTACLFPLPVSAASAEEDTIATTVLVDRDAPPRRSGLVPVLAVSALVLLAGLLLPHWLGRWAGGDLVNPTAPPPLDHADHALEEPLDPLSTTESASPTNSDDAIDPAVGQILVVRAAATLQKNQRLADPALQEALPAGAIVEIEGIHKTVDRHWLKVQLCQTAAGDVATAAEAQTSAAIEARPEDTVTEPTRSEGWIELTQLTAAGYSFYEPPPGQPWSCD